MVGVEHRHCECGICERNCGLSLEQQECYERIPTDIRPVWHPLFDDADATETLFGPEARQVEVTQWRSFPQVPEETATIPRRAVLSKDDETHMFLRYNYARSHLSKLAEKQHEHATKTLALAMLEWHDRMQDIRSDLVNANMSLVMAMAKRVRIPNTDFSDLVSEGNMALLRAIERFDVSRGFKFSTYACRAILKGFKRLASKAGRYYSRFGVSYDPDMESGDHADCRHQRYADAAIEDVMELVSSESSDLTDLERTILDERFALQGQPKGKTLAQVGQQVGLSTERVRQLQKVALAKMRRALDECYSGASV